MSDSRMEIAKVAVVGAGYMGSQIGLQCAVGGRDVRMVDANAAALDRSSAVQAELFDEQVRAGTLKEALRVEVLGRISRHRELAEAVRDVDLVFEVVREELGVKRAVFAELDRHAPAHALLATNSSSIRASKIESATKRPAKVLNTHFVTPVWKHPFVEIMGGTATPPETLRAVGRFMEAIGILPVFVRKESTGFIFNRIWRAVKKESLKVVDQGIASAEDVDRTWMIQMETPIGPCALMDRIGLDVVRDIEQVYADESGDPSDAPPKLLKDMVERGELGVKSGKGFYSYPNPSWQSPDFLKTASPFEP